jgi:mannose-6-phosphate isomerase-like protein (cupin superfamily)
MSAKSKPTVNTEAMEFFQFFDYAKPDLSTPKGLVKLVQSDILRGMVQILSPGQRNNLHSHAAEDGFYFVLKGRVRFYGPDHILAGEFGPHQGLLIPRGTGYWFENLSEDCEELEMLHVSAFIKGEKSRRVDIEPKLPERIPSEQFSCRIRND